MTTTRSRDPAALKLSAEVAWYLDTRGVPLPDCPPKVKTPEPAGVEGARFDPARVDRVLSAFRRLRHTQGRWSGQPLVPEPYQVAYILAPTYGWVRPADGDRSRWVRIIRTQYVDMPRKGGKTTLSGGQATYLTTADGEDGAQVYAVASGKDQARFCFDPVKLIAEKSPDLGPHVKVLRDRIVHSRSGSYFTVVSSVADLLHGANVHGAIVDELHVHKSRGLLEAVETGTGAREQPLVIIITTADDDRKATVYDEVRSRCERIAAGVIEDPSFYGVVWAADRDDDPFAESTWRKANPGYGITPTRAFMESAARKAQQSPAHLSSFKRLHLGVRSKQDDGWIPLAKWTRTVDMVDEDLLVGRTCYGGLDLASTADVTALAWVFPADDGTFDAVWRFFVPAGALPSLVSRTAGEADVWRREGWLTVTDGDVLDYKAVLQQIDRDARRFDVVEVAYDRWGMEFVRQQVADEGLVVVPFGQGFTSMSPAVKDWERLILQGAFRHGGNPVMRWMFGNIAVEMDAAGNVKLSKKKAADKIDGPVATVMALARAVAHQGTAGVSAYEDHGLEVV